jgi:AraC-like DNA-binding protein
MPAILNPAAMPFRFSTAAPAAELTAVVEHYWFVAWDLRGRDPHEQQVLPYPAVNVTFKPGRCRVAGVPRGRFAEVLQGTGRVFGARFRPGGFRGLLGRPVSAITDRFLPVGDVFGPAALPLADAVLAADDATAVTLLEEFLIPRLPAEPDPAAELAAAVVARIAAEPAITRVDALAAEFGVGMRQLQRLFADYVGVGPKWVIRRFRLHEVAARTTDGTPPDLVRLAHDLGYSDQAHLTRDFTSMVGQSPARYARAQ